MSTADETARATARLENNLNWGIPLYRGFNAAGKALVSSSLQGDDFDAPANPVAAEDSSTAMTLSWDFFPGATHYEVEISEDELEWTSVDDAVVALSCQATELTTATEYFMRVKAVTATGESEWATASDTTD